MTDNAVANPITTSIRSSKTYFFEVLFIKNAGGDGFAVNPVIVNLTNITRDTKTSTCRPVLYTISLSDYVLDHDEAFDDKNRELIVLACNELTQGKTRFMTIIGSDSGIGLFGSNAIVLQSLPDFIRIQIGFINMIDASDPTIYNCNQDNTFTAGAINITLKNQMLKYGLFRFSCQVQYL